MHRPLLALVCLCASACAQPSNLNGIFFQFDGMDAASTAAYLSEQAALGIDKVMTVGTLTCPGSSSAVGNLPFDAKYSWLNANIPQLLPVLLGQAQQHGMKVYLGLVNSEFCPDQSGDAAEAASVIRYLQSLSGFSSIAGWYIGNEPFIEDSEWFSTEIPYYASMVKAIRSVSSLPIITSPYLVSYSPYLYLPIGDPTTAAVSAKQFLQQTGIDILAYEDSVGTRVPGGALKLNAYPNSGDYLKAIGAAIGREHLWVVHELFAPIDLSVTGITRLNQQIAMVPDTVVSGRFSWTAQSYLSDVVPGRNNEAARLLAQYKATHGFGPDALLPINEILWVTPVSPLQGYFSPTLHDGMTGDPFWDGDPQWVSSSGAGAFYVDLFRPCTVDWVNLDVARHPDAGVKTPSSMVLYGSVDGLAWNFLGAWGYLQGSSVEREIGTQQALGVRARFLWVYVGNDATTKVSEIEVIGR